MYSILVLPFILLTNTCWEWFSGSCVGTGRLCNSLSESFPVFLEAPNLNVEEAICREAEGDVFYKLQPDELCNNIKHPWRVTIIQILNEKSFMAVVKAKPLIYIYKIDKIPLIFNLGQTVYLNLQTCQMVILASNLWDVADLLWVITAYATFWVSFCYVMRSTTTSNGRHFCIS